jgi:hypothetical protein
MKETKDFCHKKMQKFDDDYAPSRFAKQNETRGLRRLTLFLLSAERLSC